MRMRVSLCMIARDEALTLPGCLASVADLVDEILVVDTGSVDDTRDVARKLGARVHEFNWIDDFAAARNESMRHATGDWIFWLDADERLDDDNRLKLRALLENLADENTTYVMKQRSIIDSAGESSIFEQARLFRNRANFRWCYRVHEQILPALERAGCLPKFTDIAIDHFGYQDPARYRLKQERNLKLLLRQDAEHPNDSLTQFNLGLTHLTLGRKVEAVVHCRRSLELAPPEGSWVRKLYALLAAAAAEPAEALAWCNEGLVRYPNDTELLFKQAVLRAGAGDLAAAEANLNTLLQTPAPACWSAGVAPGLRGHIARHNLALIYHSQRRTAEAEAQWRLTLAERPDFLPTLLSLSELLIAQRRRQDLEPILRQLEALPQGAAAAARLRARIEQKPPPMKSVTPAYSREWYLNIHQSSYQSAKEVVPLVLKWIQPRSVVDLGCGLGSWLAVFREHGIDDFLGVDSSQVDRSLLEIPSDRFLSHDLDQPLRLARRYDLALSLEVAEHLAPECAANFVASLVALAPVVLFSAAVPYQGGLHHINEQWPGYWVDLFEKHGYLALDCLRDKLWINERVDWWYRQNLLLFCSPTVLIQNGELRRELATAPVARLPIIHPKLYLQAVSVIQELRRQLAALQAAQPSSPSNQR